MWRPFAGMVKNVAYEAKRAWLALLISLVGIGALMAIRPLSPAGLWLLIPASLLIYSAETITESSAWAKKHLAMAALIALGVSLIVFMVSGLHNPMTFPYSLDDATYHAQAQAIAEVWRQGEFPVLSAKGSPPYYIGSLHTGYQRLLATLYYLLGADYRWGILANLVAVALIPLFVYRSTLVMTKGGSNRHSAVTNQLSERNAVASAWFIALYPNLGYWSSWLLKDVILTLLFVATLGALLDVMIRRRFHVLIYCVAGWTGLATFRAYAALSLAVGVAFYLLALLPRRLAVWGGMALLIGVVLYGYSDSGNAYYSQLWYSLAQLLPESVGTPQEAVRHILVALPRLFLAPYAWVKAMSDVPIYEVYPGMWWLYLVAYPLAGAGLFRAARMNLLPAIIPLVAWAMSAYLLMLSYGGDAPRQRLYLDAVMAIFAGLGYGCRSWRPFTAMWLWLLLAYICLHLLSVGWRY